MSRGMRLSPRQLQELQARAVRQPALAAVLAQAEQAAQEPARRPKFGNAKVEDGGHTFDSRAEHRRWRHLLVLERAGEISELQLQVPYELIPAQRRPGGGKERPTVYVADFVYRTKAGTLVVEDVKGVVTPEFRLKRKLMLWRHGIEVQEVRS